MTSYVIGMVDSMTATFSTHSISTLRSLFLMALWPLDMACESGQENDAYDKTISSLDSFEKHIRIQEDFPV